LHCLALLDQQRQPLVNISDDVPCPASEVLGYAAHLLNCKLPPLQRYEAAAAELSPMARSFWSESRRVRNDLLTRQLGYRLRYPTYREGLRAALAEEDGTAVLPEAHRHLLEKAYQDKLQQHLSRELGNEVQLRVRPALE
jgi:nucleoside-diphosphate-sugar epimerase